MKLLKYNLETIINEANLIFLFLFSLHLFNFPDKYILLWCAFSIVVFWLQKRTFCLDIMFWILSLAVLLNGLGTYYYLGESLSYSWGDIIKMTIPVIIVYPFMKQAIYEKHENYIEKILLAIALGTFVYSMLNYYALLVHGFSGKGRIWAEFWTDYPMNATHHSYWGCFIAGMCGYVLYSFSEKKWIRGILFSAFIILGNLAQIAADNRMVLCVTLVSLAVSLFLYIIFNLKDKAKIRNISLVVLAGIVLVVIVFVSDIHGSFGYAKMIPEILQREEADKLVILGDLYYHGPRNPIPEEYAMDPSIIDPAIDQAIQECIDLGIKGKEIEIYQKMLYYIN